VRPESEWLEHAPFGFWLVGALRPRAIVDLTTGAGYALAAFCQAVQALGLDSRCCGIDQWPGSTGEDQFRAISDHNEAHYKAFSSLLSSDTEQASAHFEHRSVDLLHINGNHSYKAALAIYNAWRPRLSESSIVLFHNTNAYERGLGVARLWQELIQDHKHFEFLHGFGLGVLGVGDSFPSPLEHLFVSESRPEATHQLRLAYGQLGSLISARTRYEGPQAQNPDRHLHQARLVARLSEMEVELQRQSTRQSYLAALVSLREAELAQRDQMIEQLREHNEQLQRHKERQQAQQDAFLNSTSWRLTAPFRSVIGFLRR
jgi:hypothetical protein